jgi:hypothetical protein
MATFPNPKKGKEIKDDGVPKEWQIYKNLYVLFKGDKQKMKWFYENNTEADLILMIYIHNITQGFDE